MRFKIDLEYEGTRFNGWQLQKQHKSVQGEIMDAVRKVFQTEDFELYGAGRTDSGVHASGQVAHLDVATSLDTDVIRMKLNDQLPFDINILDVTKATPKFHARHDAIARSYVYQIARRRTAFGKRYVWWIKDSLNVEKMQKAADMLCGFHDFRSFTDESAEQKSTKVKVHFIDIYEDGDLLFIHIVGSHFLWKMVRRVVGVLAEIGRGKMPVEHIKSLLENNSREPARLTAPPSGLFLEKVYYQNEKIVRDFKRMLVV
jgi:tRNA pseudouridine38-40 synthase